MMLKWGRQYIHLQGSLQKTLKVVEMRRGNLHKTEVSLSIIKSSGCFERVHLQIFFQDSRQGNMLVPMDKDYFSVENSV